jgi:hypothetical protein
MLPENTLIIQVRGLTNIATVFTGTIIFDILPQLQQQQQQ